MPTTRKQKPKPSTSRPSQAATKATKTPKIIKIPDESKAVRWLCTVCNRSGYFTIPNSAGGTLPFDISLGIHRFISLKCNMKDVTMRGSKDGFLEILMEIR